MKTVFGLFEARSEAEAAIRRLQSSGVHADAIGVAMRDESEREDLAEATGSESLAEEGTTAGAISGAGVGILVGLALAGSTIALPGLGTFLVAGPLIAGLTGAGVGAVSGGLIGGLIGAGIPEAEAHHYAAGIEQGHILVTAHVPEEQAAEARRILDEEGARRTH